jgi:hypothetical protein
MNVIKALIAAIAVGMIAPVIVAAQKTVDTSSVNVIRASPAYAILLLRRTELQSDLDSLLVDYTEDYPKVKEIRLELGFLETEIGRVLAVKPADAGRLTEALGKLMLRKVELETGLDRLRSQYKDDHPDVRKARRKVDAFEAAIKEILGQ